MTATLLAWGRGRFTLIRTFSLLSALILAVIALVLANGLQRMLEGMALQQESTLAVGEAQTLLHGGLVTGDSRIDLSPRSVKQIAHYTWQYMGYMHDVRVKIWSPNGTILYSDTKAAIGHRFPMDSDLAEVLHGDLPSAASLSDLSAAENATERQLFTHLLEVYVPIHGGKNGTGHIIGAYEVYHDLTSLDAQTAQMRRAVLISVMLGFIVLYISLFIVVSRASRRLVRQDGENMRLLDESRRREAGALLLYKAGEQLRFASDGDAVLEGVLQSIRQSLSYQSCTLFLPDDPRSLYVPQVHVGPEGVPAPLPVEPGQGVAGACISSRRITATGEQPNAGKRVLAHIDNEQELAFPLLSGNELLGVLFVVGNNSSPFGERDRTLLSVVADQVAMAVQNASLFAQRESLYLATLDAMARAIDARDPYTAGHSHRVAAYAVAIARRLPIDSETLVDMKRGGVLHDIGKIGVSDATLRKPGPLSPDERVEMGRHPEIGYALLRDMSFLGAAVDMVRHHHERWDGCGYPDGLQGEQISIGARIMAVADAYDTMTSDRPYRKALPAAVARGRLMADSGRQFWSLAVDALIAVLDEGQFPMQSSEPATNRESVTVAG